MKINSAHILQSPYLCICLSIDIQWYCYCRGRRRRHRRFLSFTICLSFQWAEKYLLVAEPSSVTACWGCCYCCSLENRIFRFRFCRLKKRKASFLTVISQVFFPFSLFRFYFFLLFYVGCLFCWNQIFIMIIVMTSSFACYLNSMPKPLWFE